MTVPVECSTQAEVDAAVAAGSTAVVRDGAFSVSGSASVWAFDSASVSASDSVTVSAFDSASVSASDSVTVRAYNEATVVDCRAATA